MKPPQVGEGLAYSGDSPPDRRVMVERYLALAQTFGVKNLEIVFSKTFYTSQFWSPNRIIISRADADGPTIEHVLDHELAHAVDRVRRSRPSKGFHDEVFYMTLLEVIRARGGNPADHDWPNEYRCVWLLAARDGLTTKAWERRPKREYYFENGVRLVRWVNQPPEPVPARRRSAS